jgi:LPS sulfotransferase NodH
MKTMKCLDCDEKFKAETSEEMIKTMMPYYMEKHAEMMKGQNEETKEEWMKRFNKDWEEAEEI